MLLPSLTGFRKTFWGFAKQSEKTMNVLLVIKKQRKEELHYFRYLTGVLRTQSNIFDEVFLRK